MQIPAHRSFFRCLSLLGLVSLAVQLPAAEEPEGWSIRCARAADMPELSELPRLSLRPLPTVVTNGSAPCRIRVTDGSGTSVWGRSVIQIFELHPYGTVKGAGKLDVVRTRIFLY